MELSPQEQEHCRDLTMQLLDRTIHDCEELGLGTTHVGSHADLNCTRWKKLQSHPDVTLYADRSPNSAWLPGMNHGDWEQPVAVVTVGRLSCSLDDLLLALMTPTVATIRLRGVLMGRRPEKDLQLVPVVQSTHASPFQSLGVLRFVNTQHWPLTIFVEPREMVLTLATGEVVTANGRRFGYEIFLSVPVCHNSSKPLARTQLLETRVFWEQPDGSVGIYSKLIVDIRSRLPESIKQGMLCRGVMRFWKFIPRCIEAKKLRWCLKHKKTLIRDLQRQPQVMGGPASCGGCGAMAKSANEKPNKLIENRCKLCDAWLCWKSSCRASCQVTAVVSEGATICEKKIALCPRCIIFAQSQSAATIAQSELVDTFYE
ncbi:hypothetical protein V7S43_001984 [Phytophthora oleae]|uniref:FYVE-type domain-containing protein n=1 Tax=Phytophthora oleae TaxID=2107226 RepID=A0ABD3G0N2_9STRA